MGSYIIGPVFLLQRLTSEVYRNFLEAMLPEFSEDVAYAIGFTMWFMHDGAPAHFKFFFKTICEDHWIGQSGPHAWLVRPRYFSREFERFAK